MGKGTIIMFICDEIILYINVCGKCAGKCCLNRVSLSDATNDLEKEKNSVV